MVNGTKQRGRGWEDRPVTRVVVHIKQAVAEGQSFGLREPGFEYTATVRHLG